MIKITWPGILPVLYLPTAGESKEPEMPTPGHDSSSKYLQKLGKFSHLWSWDLQLSGDLRWSEVKNTHSPCFYTRSDGDTLLYSILIEVIRHFASLSIHQRPPWIVNACILFFFFYTFRKFHMYDMASFSHFSCFSRQLCRTSWVENCPSVITKYSIIH